MIEPQQLAAYRREAAQINARREAGQITEAERRQQLDGLRSSLGIKPRGEPPLSRLIPSVAGPDRQRQNGREYRARRKAEAKNALRGVRRPKATA